MSNQVQFIGPDVSVIVTTDVEAYLRDLVPKSMKGTVWDCLIAGLGAGEQPAWYNAPLVKDQMFLVTSSGYWLDRRMAAYGLQRPPNTGMPDDVARRYAVQVTNRQETIPAILENLEVFYGNDALHAHLTSALDEPYGLANGQTLAMTFDGLDTVILTFSANDFLDITQAKAQEVAAFVNRELGLRGVNGYMLSIVNPNTRVNKVALYSGTYGARSTVQVASGAAQAALGLSSSLTRLLGQPRASYALVRGAGEVEVFIPSTTDVVARNAFSAAYISPDYTLSYPSTPSAGVGPYLYEGVNKGLSVTGVKTTTAGSTLLTGHTYRVVSVASTALFPDTEGWVVFGYGYAYQAGPVKYLGRSGATAIVIDPGFNFPQDVPAGAYVNLLVSDRPLQATVGQSGNFWLTDSPAGRVAAEQAVTDIAAAGYHLTKTITYPGDIGLGNAGYPTSGTQAISDIVECFAGSNVDDEVAVARSN